MLEVGGGLDLGQEPLGADHGGELGAQHLERDLAVVPEVLGEVDGGHAARAELALDAVAVGEGGCEIEGRWSRVVSRSRESVDLKSLRFHLRHPHIRLLLDEREVEPSVSPGKTRTDAPGDRADWRTLRFSVSRLRPGRL